MSDSERWFVVVHGYDWIVETEGKEDDENFIADCGPGDEAEAYARSIVADHNACLNIIDPATTVPELVAVCNKMLEGPIDMSLAGLTNEAAVGAGAVLDWVQTLVLPVLAKTGRKP